MAGWARGGVAAILGSLVACSTAPPLAPAPGPSAQRPAPAVPAVSNAAARWSPADWTDLPDWGRDDLLAAWPALRAGCQRPASGWAEFCARVAMLDPGDGLEAGLLLMKHLRPWRLSAEGEPAASGLLTGYFEPQLAASRARGGAFQWPVHAPPADPALRRLPRRALDTDARMAGLALAWLDDPFALLQLQVQGSGRLLVREPDGRERLSRVAFAGHNDQPFQSVVRPLLDRGEVADATPATLRDWARRALAPLTLQTDQAAEHKGRCDADEGVEQGGQIEVGQGLHCRSIAEAVSGRLRDTDGGLTGPCRRQRGGSRKLSGARHSRVRIAA